MYMRLTAAGEHDWSHKNETSHKDMTNILTAKKIHNMKRINISLQSTKTSQMFHPDLFWF